MPRASSARAAQGASSLDASHNEKHLKKSSRSSTRRTRSSSISIVDAIKEQKKRGRPSSVTSPPHKRDKKLSSDKENDSENNNTNNHNDDEPSTGFQSPKASQGPTPYWKVLQERGNITSPRETRSSVKKPRKHKSIDDEEVGPVLLEFSPPNQAANRKKEKQMLEKKEKERALRIQQARERGQMMTMKWRESDTNDASENLIERAETTSPVCEKSPPVPTSNGNSFCLDLSPHGADSKDKKEVTFATTASVALLTNQVVHQHSNERADSESMDFMKNGLRELKELMQAKSTDTQSISIEKHLAVQEELYTQKTNNAALMESLSQSNKNNERIVSELNETRAELNEAKESASELGNTIKMMTDAFSRKEEEFEEAKSTLKASLEKDVLAAQEALHSTKASMDNISEAFDIEKSSLTEEIEKETSKNVELTHVLENSQQEKELLQKELLETKMALAAVEDTKLDEVDERLSELRAQLFKKSQLIVEADEKSVALSKVVESMEFEKKTMSEELANHASMHKALQSQLTAKDIELEDQSQELDATVSQLRTQLLEQTQRIAEAEEKAIFSSKGIENIEIEKRKMSDELENQAGMNKSLQFQLTARDNELEALSAQVDTLHAELEGLKTIQETTKETYEEECRVFQERARCSENELKAAQQKVTESKDRNALVMKELEMSKLELEATLEENKMNKGKCKQTNDALNEVTGFLNDERERADKAKAKFEKHIEIWDNERTLLNDKMLKVEKERDAAIEYSSNSDKREEDWYQKMKRMDEMRRCLHNKVIQLSGNIRVYVRVRPTLALEASTASQSASSQKKAVSNESPFNFPRMCDRDVSSSSSSGNVTASDDVTKHVLEMIEPFKDRGGLSNRRKKWKFGFDNVFTPTENQSDVWDATEPLVQSAMDGFNVCLFAYGQTGSGKTYTMLGDAKNEGLIARSVRKFFTTKHEIEAASRGSSSVAISVELLEIYNEHVRDLLAPNSGPGGKEVKLNVNSNESVGNVLASVSSQKEVMDILSLAQSRRCVRATKSNAESSRSHMIFTMHFSLSSTNGFSRQGKLHICDLAGSERLGKSGANSVSGSALLKETQNINSSLSTLSNVIEKLQSGSSHVPYRDSKLTSLLRESLGGDSKTLAIVCCSHDFHESLCSLRFAAKVNQVNLKAVEKFSC